MRMFPVIVRSARTEALDVKSFELVSRQGLELPPFAGGAHVDVALEGGLVRQYSLVNWPAEAGAYVIAVKKEPQSRGGSRWLHEKITEGSELTISAPRNNFPVHEGATHHVLLAGGIGITPMLSMARQLKAAGASFQLEYFARSLEHAAFQGVLAAPPFGEEVRFHFGLDAGGVRPRLGAALREPARGAHLYICGPRAFMDLAKAMAAPVWPPECIHEEHFTADTAATDEAGPAFEVTLARSGATYLVAPGTSIVQVLRENGVHIETSCEKGVCGTCVTAVLEGTPDHRDVFLSEYHRRTGKRMTPCVSRAKTGRLVLDL